MGDPMHAADELECPAKTTCVLVLRLFYNDTQIPGPDSEGSL
jgi:hypothetical protein